MTCSSCGRLSHQRLAGAYPRRFLHIIAKLEVTGREQDDSRSMLEPAELVSLVHPGVARKYTRPRGLRIEDDVKEMQADAGLENCRDRHQGQRFTGSQAGSNDRPLVLAEQPLNAFQRDRIDVPGVAMDE